MRSLRVAQIGNFGPPHSTENELRRAMAYALGWDVTCHQEDDLAEWGQLTDEVARYDLVLWTRTASLAPSHAVQWALLEAAEDAGVPTVSYHLDRWWGLRRENEVRREPFFRCAWVFTADGGHQDEWETIGVNHVWAPPAVSEYECKPGTPRGGYRSDLAFVGSWDDYGHAEAWHRPALVAFLRENYGGRVRFWPERGQPAVRGEALRDLYASVKVVVGDSCLLSREEAEGRGKYASDRVPETIGRGAFLLHPQVAGVTDGGMYEAGVHMDAWPIGDWHHLGDLIECWLSPSSARPELATAGQAHTLAEHTYSHRLRTVAETVGLA